MQELSKGRMPFFSFSLNQFFNFSCISIEPYMIITFFLFSFEKGGGLGHRLISFGGLKRQMEK